MPSRMIREGILDSEIINALSAEEERLFSRLCLIADDFGKYRYIPSLLKSKCFPLKDDVTETHIEAWMNAFPSELVLVYEVEGKKYLKINKFNQRLRQKVSHYPDPCQSDDRQMSDECQTSACTLPSFLPSHEGSKEGFKGCLKDRGDLKEEEEVQEKEGKKKIDVTAEKSGTETFEQFRAAYPGTKRGFPTEFLNFTKKHKDWRVCLGELASALKNQIQWRKEMETAKMFVPDWKNLKTWINNRCWEEEKPKIEMKLTRFGRRDVTNEDIVAQAQRVRLS